MTAPNIAPRYPSCETRKFGKDGIAPSNLFKIGSINKSADLDTPPPNITTSGSYNNVTAAIACAR
jgi:hypothetical protein